MGLNALTAGALKAFFESYPKGDAFLLDYGVNAATYYFQASRHMVPVPLVNIRFSKKLCMKNNIAWLIALAIFVRCIPFGYLRRKILSQNFWLNRVAAADFAASMAGGDSFSDIYGVGRLMYVALPQLLILILGKKLIILPQTIGPFKGSFARLIARIILRRAEVIYSRDYVGVDKTKELIGSHCDGGKVRFCYDVGFVLEPIRPKNLDLGLNNGIEKIKTLNPLVGVNVSGLLYMGGYTRGNMFMLKIDYRQLVHDLIEFIIDEKKSGVMLVPHVLGTHEESDTVACQEVYAGLKHKYKERIINVNGSYNQNEVKHIIGLCDFFVGSRMHACIAALSQSVPTVSIAYSGKFTGVMETIGVKELVADPRVLEREGILGIIGDAFECRDLLRGRLKETMPNVKVAVLNLFNEMRSVGKGI